LSEELLLRSGRWRRVTAQSAGWSYLSFRVEKVSRGQNLEGSTGDEEICFIVLSGACSIESHGERWELPGRRSVFEGMPWGLYLPPESVYRIGAAADLELAVAGAQAEKRHPPRLVDPESVAVEVRGAGNATRQVNHVIAPDFPAHRLEVVELYTPSGNWSSYPPHKHDEERGEDETILEEIYYYRTNRPEAFGLQRLYSPRHGLDLTCWVGNGDLLQVPYGYHMSAAPHGFDLYYLNALAGPARVRSMAASDDPAMAWIRDSWTDLERDPRVPMVTPEAATSGRASGGPSQEGAPGGSGPP
jgi:5-deoxy-glucuronate isomerase